MWEIIVIAFLFLTNIITLVWALRTRIRPTKEVYALRKAIQAFEREGNVLLHIERVDPDSIYMVNPGRMSH